MLQCIPGHSTKNEVAAMFGLKLNFKTVSCILNFRQTTVWKVSKCRSPESMDIHNLPVHFWIMLLVLSSPSMA